MNENGRCVMPAKAGIQVGRSEVKRAWIPAFAGMTLLGSSAQARGCPRLRRDLRGEPGWPYLTGGAVLLLVALLPAELAAQGCAMCRTALGGPDDPLAQAFNTSILFLMSMPFVLTALVGAWFLYMHRRGGARRTATPLLQMGREDEP